MAELAASAFAAASSAAGATAGSIGSWLAGTTVTTAAGVTSALAPAASTLTALQGALTIGSMASALLGGVMGYRQSESQARMAEIDARGAELEARQKAVAIREQTAKQVGSSRVAFAASGLDISAGGAVESNLATEADYAIGLAKDAGSYQSARSLAAADSYRSRGYSGLMKSAFKALGTGLDYKVSIARRG